MVDWDTTQKTIFIVDDSDVVLEFCRLAFASAGYQVVTRNRAAGSVAVILRQKPDVVLLEVNMPLLPGDSVAKILSKVVGTKIVLLLHSDLPIETLRLKALSSGAHGYVKKSNSPTELVHRVEECMQRVQRTSGAMRIAAVETLSDEKAPTSARFGRAEAPQRPSAAAGMRAGGGETPSYPVSSASPRTASSDTPARYVPASGTIRTPMRVLFADPDRAMLDSFRQHFALDLTGQYVTSGDEALASVLSEEPPDVVVASVALSGTTGPELYRCARAVDPRLADRFIFIADSKMSAPEADFLSRTGARVFYKPVSPPMLLEAVRRFERERRLARAR